MSRNIPVIDDTMSIIVAPREGRVSRNVIPKPFFPLVVVAPREGRVSRNRPSHRTSARCLVAPREGRVSRNNNLGFLLCEGAQSRPARGV